jgi:hypothetical protein
LLLLLLWTTAAVLAEELAHLDTQNILYGITADPWNRSNEKYVRIQNLRAFLNFKPYTLQTFLWTYLMNC